MSEEMMQAERGNVPEPAELLAAVLRRCRKKWFRFVLRIVQNHADAEDALQEGFCRVLASNRYFQTEEQARMYLARTISNTAFEIYHARRREKRHHLPVHEYQLPDQCQTTPQIFLEKREDIRKRIQVMRLLQQALNGLSFKQIEALRMTVLDTSGSSIRDVGEINGIAYSTLRHRRVQGLRRLRRYIFRALRNNPIKLILA